MGDEGPRGHDPGSIDAVMGKPFAKEWNTDPDAFDFTFKEFCGRVTFEEVWRRPGLDRRSRRLVTLGILIALGQDEALRSHIRAALLEDLSPAELHEALFQSSIYCGVPAALRAFAIAGDVVQRRNRG